jgi:hypothetical protein
MRRVRGWMEFQFGRSDRCISRPNLPLSGSYEVCLAGETPNISRQLSLSATQRIKKFLSAKIDADTSGEQHV